MGTVTIDVRELPGRLEELLSLAAAGTEVLVQDGPATGKLVSAPAPVPPVRREWKLGLHPGAMEMRDDFNEPIDEEAFLRGDF